MSIVKIGICENCRLDKTQTLRSLSIICGCGCNRGPLVCGDCILNNGDNWQESHSMTSPEFKEPASPLLDEVRTSYRTVVYRIQPEASVPGFLSWKRNGTFLLGFAFGTIFTIGCWALIRRFG